MFDVDTFYQRIINKKKSEEKIAWTRNILQTNHILYGLQAKEISQEVSNILQGDVEEFLETRAFANYDALLIYGKVLATLNSPTKIKFYLDKYLEIVDSWALIDCLIFKINKSNSHEYIKLINYYKDSPNLFGRRLAIYITLLILRTDINFTSFIFALLENFKDEKEYYVNMMGAWVLSECLIKDYKTTLVFMQKKTLSKFVNNKAIAKARDSFRLDKQRKDDLIEYRIK